MRIEKIFCVVFIIATVFKNLSMPIGSPLLIITLTTLSLLYFTCAFYLFCDRKISRQNIALSIISGIVLSVTPMAVLFKLLYWPNRQELLVVGSISSIILLGVVSLLKAKAPEDLGMYYRNMIIRTATLPAVAVILLFTSSYTLLRLQYRIDPERARITSLHYDHPENEQYRLQYEAYLRRLDSLYNIETENGRR